MRNMVQRVGLGPLLALLPVVAVAVTLLAWPRFSHYSAAGIEFDYPSGWTIHDNLPPTTGMGQEIALLGTMPWGPCDESDINCHFRERLNRHEIELQVSVGSLMGSDFCAYAQSRLDLEPRTDGVRVNGIRYVRIDGRPAIATQYSLDSPDYYLADGWRKWEIAPADTTEVRYTIFAMWRGPDDDEILAALDRLVASITLTASGYAQPSIPDCGAPFPAKS